MKRLAMATLLLMCSACIQLGSDPLPMRHYLLQPNAGAQQLSLDSAVEFTLDPLRFPAYLDRLQLTSHNDQHQVLIAPQDRWSEPLEESITRVVNENLARHLLDGRTQAQSDRSTDSQKVQLALTINSFDGILGQNIDVDIRWTITRAGDSEQIQHGHFIDKASIGSSHAELVRGLNAALDRFSYALAQAVARSL